MTKRKDDDEKNVDAARLSALRMSKMTEEQRKEVSRIGGKARSAQLSAKARRKIAKMGAEARIKKLEEEKAKEAGGNEQ